MNQTSLNHNQINSKCIIASVIILISLTTCQAALTASQALLRPLKDGESRASLATRVKNMYANEQCGISVELPMNLAILANSLTVDGAGGNGMHDRSDNNAAK